MAAARNNYSQHQQLTPPATSSSMHYPYDSVAEANPIVQTSSAPNYDLNSYAPYNSPKEDGLPSTMDGYHFNSYPVTAPPAEDGAGSAPLYSFAATINGNGGYMGQAQQRLPPPNLAAYTPQYASPPQGSHQQQHAQGLAPILSPSRPPAYHPTRNVGSEYTGTPTIPSLSMGQHNPAGATAMSGRRVSSVAPSSDHRRTPRTPAEVINDVGTTFRGNGPTGTSNMNGAVHSTTQQGTSENNASPTTIHDAIPAELANWVITDNSEVELNEKAAEDDRFLFRIHKDLKSHRGKGMWENISAEFRRTYPDSYNTARLQMKYTRAVRRHARWPKEDVSSLLSYSGTRNRRPKQQQQHRGKGNKRTRKKI